MKTSNKEFIAQVMKNPKATDEELAKATGISRSGAAKKRTQLEQAGKLMYFAGPDLSDPVRVTIMQGHFKFSPAVSHKTIEKFAKKLAKDENFISLWIRRIAADKLGLCFMYLNETGKSEAYEEQTGIWQKMLLEEFGSDWTGFDIAGRAWWLKFMGQEIKQK